MPFLLFLVAFYSHRINKPQWFTRKLIHTFGLFIVGLYGSFLNNFSEVLTVLLIFLIILAIFSIIPQIRMFQELIRMGTRKGERQIESLINTTLTAVSILTLMAISFTDNRHFFFAGVLSVAIGDGLGEFIGKPYGMHKYRIFANKSYEGSIGVFFGTLIGCIIAFLSFDLTIFSSDVITLFIIASLVATLIEAFSVSFIDNITMPWAVAGILWYFL